MKQTSQNSKPIPVLSIQSFVSYGHVGNSAISFPLQLLNCQLVTLPTVIFSNHTGYGEWTGEILNPDMIYELFQGVRKRFDLSQLQFFLTGYMGSVALGRTIEKIYWELKQENPNLLYCCDPVMGDVGRGFFVKPELPEFFQKDLIPRADIITPNHFELEFLCGKKVTSVTDAVTECRKLISQGPKIVLVTSFISEKMSAKKISVLVVTADQCFSLTTPKVDVALNGTGDLTAALFTYFFHKTGRIKSALEQCISRLYGIIYRTHKSGSRELTLVENQKILVKPSRLFAAEQLN